MIESDCPACQERAPATIVCRHQDGTARVCCSRCELTYNTTPEGEE
ncbi:MAG TPA: hypothetical protein VFX29_00845 [Longimicrobiaceae bacterium]|nr:hypothetical protein [Longimicrobiaceae bacterium]